MPDRVRITDVAPRDGLQNEPGVITTADKARLVEMIARTGVDEIEVSSFVSPRWIPQLGDAADLFARLADVKPQHVSFSALVPNEQGLSAALGVNGRAGFRLIDKVSVFTAASETFSRRNTNATIAETLARFVPVAREAHRADMAVRAYISCVVACPFEGPIAPARVADAAIRLLDLDGVAELDLGDTIGAATPDSIAAMIDAVRTTLDAHGSDATITVHLHDTFGRASACVDKALLLGVRSFDGSIAGLGGCPYASTNDRRAPGNIATDALVRTIERAGYETGVDHDQLTEAATFARSIVDGSRDREPEADA
ncbi:MAG: hydroxymethylglutaryl-CoA lyase [Planctomycetes bacterium]|nr:hydroxymethylglutaryl-CoA lyase [Planctomycetota bacterium]